MSLAALACVAMLVAVQGCGYALMEPSAGVSADIKTLFVTIEEGKESDPVTADALGRELRGVVRREGRFRLAESEGLADAVLRVEIVSSLTRPVAFDRFDDVLDYETTLRIDAGLVSSSGVLWERDRIAATRSHAAVAGAVVTSSSSFQSSERLRPEDLDAFDTVQIGEQRKSHARRELVQDLARTVYQLMTEGR